MNLEIEIEDLKNLVKVNRLQMEFANGSLENYEIEI
jgi:hypothetical protein